jgi:hypothetical protein
MKPTENFDLTDSAETGKLGVFHLKRFWHRSLLARDGRTMPLIENEWMLDKIALFGLGVSLEDTFQYICQNNPTFEEFENWILAINDGKIQKYRIERINAAVSGRKHPSELEKLFDEIERAEPVLSAEDLNFWNENGYVIVRNAISKNEAEASAQAVWNYLEADPHDPQTWYRKGKTQGIMVQSFHHPAFRRNRQSKRIHKAFAQIWQTADLWTTIDRAGFNPPENLRLWTFPGPNLHWDMSLELPHYFGTQGILYLTDVVAGQGAFTCVPGFQHRIESWLQNLPPDANPREQDLESLGAKPIAANAGDFIIWHQALPHGSSPNRAAFPRIVQYINMFPNRRDNHDDWR